MLIIKNGTLISMAGIYKETYDVAVENGKIAKVEKEINPPFSVIWSLFFYKVH